MFLNNFSSVKLGEKVQKGDFGMIDAYLDGPLQNGGLSFVVHDIICMISWWWKKSSKNRSFTFYFNISPDNASLKRPHSSTEHHASSL
jgi:hypothetical protein